MNKSYSILISFTIFFSIFLFGCKVTTHNKILVDFSSNSDSVTNELLNLIKCEHVNISGSETIVNGKHANSELLIEILNPIDLSSKQEVQDELTMKIARLFKPIIKNNEVFDTFKVLFVFQSTNGATTTTKTTGHIWKKSEM